MDKSELKKIADSVFERYPNVDKVFVTSDGQAFFEEAHARNHAAPNKKHKELEIETFRRNGEETKGHDLDNMDRVQLEAFIKDNGIEIVYYAETPDEDLRTMIENTIKNSAETAKVAVKKTTKKAK